MNIRTFKHNLWMPYAGVVGVLHILGIAFILWGKASPFIIGLGFISYTLGLKHAFDIDHIAAIDNTVRKLVQQKKNPIGVGFFFSIGHSSVVFIMAITTVLSVHWAKQALPQFQEIGGLIGTIVSGSFLVIIGLINFVVLKELYKLFIKMRHNYYDPKEIESLLISRGLMARFFSPLFKLVTKSWHVYPLGFLFGLGFDTASEVALLTISASAGKQSIPIIGMLSLPILFAAGMSLMDTADGVFMVKAYKWAFSTPVRKVYYNLTITAISVFAALFIGIVELTQVLSNKLNLTAGPWGLIQRINFGWLGYILVGLFITSWLISYLIWRLMNIEERWESKQW